MDKYNLEKDAWFSWSNHVLITLEQHTKILTEVQKDLTLIKADLKLLKFKASLLGATAGSIPAIIMWVVK